MTIGVFDSGVGGRSVEKAIQQAFSKVKTEYVNDKKNIPYGDKSADELLKLTVPILQDLARRCDMIVVACNTVTTTIINELREVINVPLVGIEPMIKPAAGITKTQVIAVCATPATLKSQRYKWLKKTYAKKVEVLEPDCSDWAAMIEQNKIDKQKIIHLTDQVLSQKADVIVLGCTHYHWIQEMMEGICANRATVLQPEEAIATRLKQLYKI